MMLISKIQHYSTNDGPGIRTTVFMKGCGCGCLWCQNPEALHDKIEEIKGAVYGTWMSEKEVFDQVMKDYVFYQKSGGGVTFSGGDPLMQINPLFDVLRALKREYIHTCLDIYANCTWEVLACTIPVTNLYLYDIKVMDPEKHQKYIGIGLKQPLDNLARLRGYGADVVVRTPLIPGVNMDDRNIISQADYMREHDLDRIELIPYHPQAKDKYSRMGWPFLMADTPAPEKKDIERVMDILSSRGIKVINL